MQGFNFSGAVRSPRLAGAALLLALCMAAHAEGLSTGLQQQIRAATFEVVQRKPEDGTVISYEKPLPLDLIPYQQRIDKYRSIGTAFAIDGHRFVTAAHVLGLGFDSQYGPPALRDTAGHVFDIAQVVKYSQEQDFAVVTLKGAPDVAPLQPGPKPMLNDPLYAVGNALGEGVVIRDGVFTSETPEEEEGRWQWLRFSAAASPGNSGGPLVDTQGRLVGIVLRKSANENLNYAAPFALVTAASETQGMLGARAVARLPMLDASEKIDSRHGTRLPQSLADFYTAIGANSAAAMETSNRTLLEHNAARLFPASPGAQEVLLRVVSSPLPRLIHETADRRWAVENSQTGTARLPANGFVVSGGGGMRLRAPDNVRLRDLYSDSKLYMDLLLQGALPLRRQVGTDSVKVTSLGKAVEHASYTDAYGRTWQILVWAMPYDDSYIISFNLPTPEGYAALVIPTPSMARQTMIKEAELLLSYFYVTLHGSIDRWHEYLALPDVQPRVLSALNLSVEPDKLIRLHSKRLELEVTPQLQSLGRTAEMSLNFSFFRDGAAVVWDLGGLSIQDRTAEGNSIGLHRAAAPGADLPESFQTYWNNLTGGSYPYNGKPTSNNGTTRASIAAPVAGVASADTKVLYQLTASIPGSSPDPSLDAKLAQFKASFKALEH